MKIASTIRRLRSEQGHERDGQAGQSERQAAGRLLALEDERGGEDGVGEEDHDHDPLEADRGRDGGVDDGAQADADAGQDQQGVGEEQADAAGHRADSVEHGACIVATGRDRTPDASAALRQGIDTDHDARYGP